MYSRRKFIFTSAAALGGLAASTTVSARLAEPTGAIGIQLFSIPGLVSADFKGTMTRLAEIGYREIEFFGPYDFSAKETIEGWNQFAGRLGITRNAFYGLSIGEVKALLKDLGLTAPSVHLDLVTMRTNMRPAMEALSALGTKYVVIPSISNPEDRNDFNKLADEFNQFGKQMAEHGLVFTYHNHGYEHTTKDGTTLMEVLLSETDPETVKFELDIFWMTAAGASPIEHLKKYPGRFKLLHLKDAAEPVRFAGDGGSPDQWMPLFGKMTDPGKGVFDIAGIIKAAKKSGAEHFYLERDLAPDPDKTLTESFTYLKKVR